MTPIRPPTGLCWTLLTGTSRLAKESMMKKIAIASFVAAVLAAAALEAQGPPGTPGPSTLAARSRKSVRHSRAPGAATPGLFSKSPAAPAVPAWCDWFTACSRAATIGTISSRVSTPAGRPSSHLRLYLTHFRGLPLDLSSDCVAPEPESKAWDALTGPPGLAGTTMGQRWNTSAGVPSLAGLIEGVGEVPPPTRRAGTRHRLP